MLHKYIMGWQIRLNIGYILCYFYFTQLGNILPVLKVGGLPVFPSSKQNCICT